MLIYEYELHDQGCRCGLCDNANMSVVGYIIPMHLAWKALRSHAYGEYASARSAGPSNAAVNHNARQWAAQHGYEIQRIPVVHENIADGYCECTERVKELGGQCIYCAIRAEPDNLRWLEIAMEVYGMHDAVAIVFQESTTGTSE